MKTYSDLKRQLHEIDHKGYKAYKVLEGSYDFGSYSLCIDHVQGDPFATPSRVRIVYDNRENIPPQYFETKFRRIATEDALLRLLHKNLQNPSLNETGQRGRPIHSGVPRMAKGSGKSGMVSACRTGQEVLERTAMRIKADVIEARIEIGFPAFGRTIAAGELGKILFDELPRMVKQTFQFNPQMRRKLDQVTELADDQQYIRKALDDQGLVAFVADGSILPRESGVSEHPMKNPVPFVSPESLALTLELPHRGRVRGMGVKKGITLIAGGGFHGKSTLLEALERGVYNHIAGDGRELVITDPTAFKLRAEEGRCVHETDISMFIDHLPNRADTTCFSTENASGSTSQAANTVEALASGSRVLLIDEDTSATNFMVRDSLMAQLVSDEKEPITPFIRKIRSLYQNLGVSTVLVVGSSGEYLTVADTILQMDCYVAKDVTAQAKGLTLKTVAEQSVQRADWLKKPVGRRKIEKVRTHGWDTISLDKRDIDLRDLEQITDETQTAALAYLMQYILEHLADGKKTAAELAKEAADKIEKDGILSVTPKNYGAGAASAVRRQEILACMTRYRML